MDRACLDDSRSKGILALIIFFNVHASFAHQWTSEYYHQGLNGEIPQVKHALKEVPKLGLKGDERVLDVGCGDGKISNYLAEQWLPNGTIHGIDISPAMITAAQQHKTAKNISFECMSLFSYQPTELYDEVVCFWVLYLFDNYEEALARVMELLKPQGKALICHIIDPGTPFLQMYTQKIAPQKLPFTLPTVETILRAIKVVNAHINYFEIKYNYDFYPSLITFITGMHKIPCFPLLSQEQEAELCNALAAVYPEVNGSIKDYSLVVCMVLEKQ